MRSKKQLLEDLIEEQLKELVKSEFFVDYYQKEFRNPKKIGKAQAEESLNTWRKHVASVEDQIRLYKDYYKHLYTHGIH